MPVARVVRVVFNNTGADAIVFVVFIVFLFYSVRMPTRDLRLTVLFYFSGCRGQVAGAS